MSQQQILLLGAYGQRNLGDDALLEVFLDQLHDARIVVNSARPEETSQRYGVAAVDTYMSWPRLSRLRMMLSATAFVFGGGSLLKEVEGGPITRVLYFLRILLLLLAGKLLGRPTAMLGVGIGPLTQPFYQRLARLAANMTDLICVRDTASYELLSSIGVRRPIYVTADPVFTWNDLRPIASAPSTTQPTIVVIPRYSFTESQAVALAATCDRLVATHNAQIILLAFQAGYEARFDDKTAAQLVRQHMQHRDAVQICAPERTREAVELIAKADLVVSARLHGLIFATLARVPAVALDYEVKVRSFMAEIGQSWASVSLADLEAGKLPAVLDEAWEWRDEISEQLETGIQQLQERSIQNFSHFQELLARPRTSLISGSMLLLASMTLVNAGNYVSNLVLGRWLGPSAFADFSLMVTGFLIVTLITSTLQTISAKFSAMASVGEDATQIPAVRAWLNRWAWGIGIATLALFALGAPLWQQFFHTASIWPFVILGVGLPFYYAQGIDRGALQGQTHFARLSLTYQVEMWSRLILAVGFVALGWATNGAVAGITLSLVAAWAIAAWANKSVHSGTQTATPALSKQQRQSIIAFSGPVIAALIGQVMINNSDILIVKHFFAAEAAGHYAALALIGRVVFFATISVVAVMFPIVAQKQQRGEPHHHLLWVALGIVAAASAAVIMATLLFPELMVQILFGNAYLPIAPLLWLYAIATMLYALANVVINYRLSVGNGGGSALVMLAGVAQVAGLLLFHGSLQEVVVVQIILMVILLVLLLAWDWWLHTQQQHTTEPQPAAQPALSTLRTTISRRWRSLLLGGIALAMLLLMWQAAAAQATRAGNPAHEQIKQILPALRDSEAEQASGAYIPNVGAVITLDLLRGPNAWKDKAPDAGVRDWAFFLMGEFGPKLSAVPADEVIAISINYYEYAARTYHPLVITSRAGDVSKSDTYAVWLDGLPINPTASLRDAQPASGTAPAPSVGGSLLLDFNDPQTGALDWTPLAGQWAMSDQGYAQTEPGRYDLISLLNRPVTGDYTLQVELKYLSGDMGGGLVFHAPDPASKNGAQIINYSEKGSYLQWGSFDSTGVFSFKGGSPVPSGADGNWHTLSVEVTGTTYSIRLDDATIVEGVPLAGTAGGRVGLLASTSNVLFDNLKLESQQP